MKTLKAYKYRLYPTKKQQEQLQWTLDRARELYNAALQERRDAYEIRVKRHPNYYDEATRKRITQEHALTYTQQATQLAEIKEIRPEYHDIHSQVLQDVLRRVEKAYKAFFRRIKEGKTPGYPRFQGYGRYESFMSFSPVRWSKQSSTIGQMKQSALMWACCILPPSPTVGPLRTHAMCAIVKINSKSCKRHCLQRSGDQSVVGKPHNG